MTEPLAVLYEDIHVLAVSKPAGLLTQGTAGREPTLEQAARRYLASASTASVYLGTVHRLDRPVSGVVLWAKTPKAARRLADEFAARRTVKEYWAVVEVKADSHPGPDAGPPSFPLDVPGVWDDWLSRSTDESGVVVASRMESPGSRRAVTRYQAERGGRLPAGSLWLRLWPETGRTHQLRAQASFHGVPVWGDADYGSPRVFEPGIALHARALTFRHPVLRSEVTVTAPIPASWARQGMEPG